MINFDCKTLDGYVFQMQCDKCEWVFYVCEKTREATQMRAYREGWRVNSAARKYFHLCPKHAK